MSDDYEVQVEVGPRSYSARGPSPDVGYKVYLSTCDISEGGHIAFSPDKSEALAELDVLIGHLVDARQRLVNLP